MSARFRLSRRVLLMSLALFALAGGIAYASIPDAGTGTFHACMLKGVGTIRIIDPTTQHCSTTLETPIAFGAKGDPGPPGPPGAPGTNGVSPTIAQLPAGDPNCATGGAAITDAAGSTAYVCNGAAGADGAPFNGTFTSPNGQYSITVSDNGITLSAPGNSSVRLVNSDLNLRGASLNARYDFDMMFNAGSNLSLRSSNNAELKASGQANVEASSQLTVKGSSISINGSSSCAPAVRTTDAITAADPAVPSFMPVVSLGSGSATVCIG